MSAEVMLLVQARQSLMEVELAARQLSMEATMVDGRLPDVVSRMEELRARVEEAEVRLCALAGQRADEEVAELREEAAAFGVGEEKHVTDRLSEREERDQVLLARAAATDPATTVARLVG